MNLSHQHYVLAKNIGLTLWFERSALFVIESPCLFASLGIFLSQALKSEEEQKVFKGMLSVLSLEATSYWIGWLPSEKQELRAEDWRIELQKWRPQAVLGMGPSLRKALGEGTGFENLPCTATYHPKELIENPTLKKKAYQDLLNLKETLKFIKAE